MTANNWLTPETAIGATLPCGAKVVRAEWHRERIVVDFDHPPSGSFGPRFNRSFKANGEHTLGELPNLTPPQPTEAGVMVTREALREALGTMGMAAWTDSTADALGIPPAAPVKAPWEVAYEAWYAENTSASRSYQAAWQAAVEWTMTEACNAMGFAAGAHGEIRRRIMGKRNDHNYARAV
jgi:hypothetical protein